MTKATDKGSDKEPGMELGMEPERESDRELEKKAEAVCRKALITIRPKKGMKKDISRSIAAILSGIERRIESQKIKARVMLGGSLAKGTNLAGDHDVDLFVIFSQQYKDKNISGLLGQLLKPMRPTLLHGSRDYFQIPDRIHERTRERMRDRRRAGITYEVVPVLETKKADKAVNVTDVSPMHVEWFCEQSRRMPGLPDEIRLAKQFCKAADCYGAESYIRGFSGHVLDILVAHYGSFIKLLRASQKWKQREVIDFHDRHRGRALQNLNRAKTESALIVIDPLDPSRNAAAALDQKRCDRFVAAAKGFLERLSLSFFRKKELTPAALRRKAGKNELLIVSFRTMKGKRDIAGSRMVKAYAHLKRQLRLHDFTLLDSGLAWDGQAKGFYYFILKKEKLDKRKLIMGPPRRARQHARRFAAKHGEVLERDGRLYAKVPRRYLTARDLLKSVLGEAYVQERLAKAGISKH